MEKVFVGSFQSNTKKKTLNVNVEGDYLGGLLALAVLTKSLKEQNMDLYGNDSLTQVLLKVMVEGVDDAKDVFNTKCLLKLNIEYDEENRDVKIDGQMDVNYQQWITILVIIVEQLLSQLEVMHGDKAMAELLDDFEGVCGMIVS